MRNFRKWLWLLNKRLYKKVTFLLILLLIPTLVLGYGLAAQEESGVLTIALAQEADDPMATQVIDKLCNDNSIIRFVVCDSPATAEKMITDGKADAAWIFPDEMEEKVYKFINYPSRFNAFIRVVELGDSVPLKLTREKLSGTVLALTSKLFYLNYIRTNVPELSHLSDEELGQYYDGFAPDIELFHYESLDGSRNSQENENVNYLTTPVRGLLAVVVVLGGLAAAMYYIRDNNAGTFSLVSQRRKGTTEFICQFIAVGNIAVVVFLALLLSGLITSIGRELLVLLLYVLAASLFCMNIRRLCRKLSVIGAVLPLLIVVMLVVCPVFFDFGFLRIPQYIFPPTYYVNAVYSDRFLALLCLYDGLLLSIYYLTGKLFKRA